ASRFPGCGPVYSRPTPIADRGEKLIEVFGPQPRVDVALGRLVESCFSGKAMISSAHHEAVRATPQVQRGTRGVLAVPRPEAQLRLTEWKNFSGPPIAGQAFALT